MNLLKISSKDLLTWAGFIFLYFLTRLYQIMSLPMFTDEAIYTRWAQIAKLDPNWRFISLTDGKQPLFIWFDMVFMKFVEDPLLAGRLVSVFAGFATLIGIYLLGKTLFNKRIGIIAVFLYIFYPFALVYDRMALYDSLVATFAVWALFFQVLLIKYKRLDIALVLGFILGGSVLNKTSGFISIYLLPVSLLLFNFKKNKPNLLKWVGLAILSVAMAYGFYSILRLSPFLHIISEKNQIFVYTFSQWLAHPFEFLEGNLRGVFDWAYTYLTLPVALLVASSFVISKKNLREKLLLLGWFIIPILGLALFGKTLYPRFVLFMTMPLLILAAYSLSMILAKAKTNVFKALVIFIVLSFSLRSNFLILSDFKNAPIPYSDLEQYINSWPAGGGVNEAVEFFKEKSKKEKIYIATQGSFGLMPYALEIYFHKIKNVTVKGFWPISDTLPSEVVEAGQKMPTYFIFYQPCDKCEYPGHAPESLNLELVKRYSKGEGNSYLSIYQLK